MNREEKIGQLEELLYNFENEETVDCTKDDVEALKFAIDELRKSSSLKQTTTNELN
ncbi:MAG: hypothetical protein ACRC1T_12195 [Clostridium chrysemydis]|uniref:hypothetical protein n=1 Tax=Clostridium chrysemydis TaxID=2665504 RepID=UPI003F2BA915